MADVHGMARTVAQVMSTHPNQTSFDVETHGLSGTEVRALVDALFTECEAAGVEVKGIRVDPMQIPLPANAEFVNAFFFQ